MGNAEPVTPYGSARDLPSIRELQRQSAALSLLSWLLPKEQRRDLHDIQVELGRITGIVDDFYRLLGARNWVYTDDLATSSMEGVTSAEDPDEAERRLITYYKEDGRIDFAIKRLSRHEQMRERLPLLEKALADYRAGRFYAVVLVLIPAMDGFVNDVEAASRRGLHAREPGEMVAWDSVTGHHLGLAHAHRSFVKPFFKTETSEVTELYRNGILHGTVVNFDNVVVATKAWNRLFAVTDWAEARAKQTAPVEPAPTLRELLERWGKARARSAKVDAWRPHEYIPNPDSPTELAQACTSFLQQWQRRQWGLVGAHLLGEQFASDGRRARVAKATYGSSPLTRWELRAVRHTAAAVAVADVTLHTESHVHDATLRWVRVDDAGTSVGEWEPGTWLLTPFDPAVFFGPDAHVE